MYADPFPSIVPADKGEYSTFFVRATPAYIFLRFPYCEYRPLLDYRQALLLTFSAVVTPDYATKSEHELNIFGDGPSSLRGARYVKFCIIYNTKNQTWTIRVPGDRCLHGNIISNQITGCRRPGPEPSFAVVEPANLNPEFSSLRERCTAVHLDSLCWQWRHVLHDSFCRNSTTYLCLKATTSVVVRQMLYAFIRLATYDYNVRAEGENARTALDRLVKPTKLPDWSPLPISSQIYGVLAVVSDFSDPGEATAIFEEIAKPDKSHYLLLSTQCIATFEVTDDKSQALRQFGTLFVKEGDRLVMTPYAAFILSKIFCDAAMARSKFLGLPTETVDHIFSFIEEEDLARLRGLSPDLEPHISLHTGCHFGRHRIRSCEGGIIKVAALPLELGEQSGYATEFATATEEGENDADVDAQSQHEEVFVNEPDGTSQAPDTLQLENVNTLNEGTLQIYFGSKGTGVAYDLLETEDYNDEENEEEVQNQITV